MTLILEIPVEVEERLKAVAQARGVAVEAVAVEQLAGIGTLASLETDPDAALDVLLDSIPNRRALAGLPPLTDEQLNRAAFYEE